MKKILCVWELGGNFGHLTNLATIAETLVKNGFEVVVALRDLQSAEWIFQTIPVILLQSPVFLGRSRLNERPSNMADILYGLGYGNSSALAGLVSAWRGLFKLVRPEIIIFDYAPTALLAASDLPVKRIVTGIGFSDLPPGNPIISLEEVKSSRPIDLKSREAEIVNNINLVAKLFRLPRVNYISDLYSADKSVVANIPALDIYAKFRRDVVYRRPEMLRNRFPRQEWPKRGELKVLMYLDYNVKNVPVVLQLLKEMNLSLLGFIKNIGENDRLKLNDESCTMINSNLDIESALETANIVIVHGGNLLVQAILSNKKVVSLPTQLEQRCMVRALEENQLGIVVYPDQGEELIGTKLRELVAQKLDSPVILDIKDENRKSAAIEVLESCQLFV
jgi:hypothetical protein